MAGTRKLLKSGIRSEHLNQRDAGFEYEKNDCAVKALMAVTGVPYRDAHAWSAVHFARKDCGAAMLWDKALGAHAQQALTIFGYRVYEQPAPAIERPNGYKNYGTLAQFVRTHSKGRFLLSSTSHAFALIDGVVYDNGAAGAKTRVTYKVYELKPSSQCV